MKRRKNTEKEARNCPIIKYLFLAVVVVQLAEQSLTTKDSPNSKKTKRRKNEEDI